MELESPIEIEPIILDGAIVSIACVVGSAIFVLALQCFVICLASVVILVHRPLRAPNHDHEPLATKCGRPAAIAVAGAEATKAQEDDGTMDIEAVVADGGEVAEEASVAGAGEEGGADDGIFCAINVPGEEGFDEQCDDDASTEENTDMANEGTVSVSDPGDGEQANGGNNDREDDAITSYVDEDEGDHRERHAEAIAKIIAKKRAKELAHEIRRQKLSSETVTIKLILCNSPDSQKISTLTIPKTTTPASLWKSISQAAGIPEAEIRVLYRGRSISQQSEGWVVFQFNIRDGSALHVLGRPRQPKPCDTERAALIQEQDTEYQESLRKDQERARKVELEKKLRQRRREELGEAKRRLLAAGVQLSLLSNNDETEGQELNCRVRLHLPSGQKVEGSFARRHRMGLVYDLALLALAKEGLLWNQEGAETVESAHEESDSGSDVIRDWGTLRGLLIRAMWHRNPLNGRPSDGHELFRRFSVLTRNQKAFDRLLQSTFEECGLSNGATLLVVVESD